MTDPAFFASDLDDSSWDDDDYYNGGTQWEADPDNEDDDY